MASTTVTTAHTHSHPSSLPNSSLPPFQQQTQPHRASFSTASSAPLAGNPTVAAPSPAQSSSQPVSGSHQSAASFDGNPLGLVQQHTMAATSQPSSQQSFSMSQPSSSQQASAAAAAAMGTPTYRPYGDPSKMGHDLIYSAVYSGVDVYEMEVNNIAVMRRRDDSYLNATQILKVAGVDKGKRTKILEKEIQTGHHEKVQGGYGKYQGTWIKFERGVEVCRQYGVEEILRPLLTYDMGQDGGVAGRGVFNTPTKEQAMAAQRKRMYNSNNENRANGMAGTFFKSISATASHAVAAISKARFDSPGPKSRSGPARAPSFHRQSSMHSMDDFPGNSQQSMTSEYGANVDSAYSTQSQAQVNGENPEPPRKRQRVNMTPADSFTYAAQPMEMYANAFPGSPTEPNESFIYSQQGINLPDSGADGHGGLAPLPFEMSPEAENKRSMLMGLFMDSNATDHKKHEMLGIMTPTELDMPIDAQSHTALHWAATLSRMPLLRALIASGASAFRVNASGETALMRACVVTNSHDHNSMPELLDILGDTIEICDAKGRTVLHHIAVTSAVKGRNAASRYYLESLLEWVVKQGRSSNRSSQNVPGSQGSAVNGSNGIPSSQPYLTGKLDLARFMGEMVNAQDKAGDTALNIAARIGNRSIISQLLEVRADPNIANRAGLRPIDFGIGIENGEEGTGENGAANGETNGAVSNSQTQRSRESSDEIVTSITHLLSETSSAFQSELKGKQQSVEALHSSLRTTSTQLGEARRTFESLQQKVKSQQLARQKVVNLSRASEDEQYHLLQLEQRHGRLDVSQSSWETELDAMLGIGESNTGGNGTSNTASIPSAALLRARVKALRQRSEATQQAVSQLKSRSRESESKYRHLVALAVKCADEDVDSHLDGLMRAVESEKGELEIGRVRRFLGGVNESVGVH